MPRCRHPAGRLLPLWLAALPGWFVVLLMVAAGAFAQSLPATVSPALLAPFRPPAPDVEPASSALLALGKTLFFDPILSGSGSTSCATCHNPGLSWGAGLPRAVGDGGNVMSLRAPTLIDIAPLHIFGWDGKFPTMESVTFAAITSHANMNLETDEALRRVRGIEGYRRMFDGQFPGQGITQSTVEEAIAAYERTIVSYDAPFDRFVAGDEQAISEQAKKGFVLFTGKAHCSACHSGWSFTDGSFHDIGSATGDDVGRGALFPTSKKLLYAFKTPTLRDVAHRAPYMHDGSVATLQDVIALYDRGGIDRPSRSELIHPLGLTDAEREELIAFLQTLTSAPEPVSLPILPR